MNNFLQTLAIAVIPSAITSFLSYLAAAKNLEVQVKTIQEQNNADIEKLVQQNKVDIETLKEKHQLEMETKEKEFQHQIEMVKIQHQNELKINEENLKNQLSANAMNSLFNGIFSSGSPISTKLNEVLTKELEDAMKE